MMEKLPKFCAKHYIDFVRVPSAAVTLRTASHLEHNFAAHLEPNLIYSSLQLYAVCSWILCRDATPNADLNILLPMPCKKLNLSHRPCNHQ